jgi:hypothetical protein
MNNRMEGSLTTKTGEAPKVWSIPKSGGPTPDKPKSLPVFSVDAWGNGRDVGMVSQTPKTALPLPVALLFVLFETPPKVDDAG